MGQFLYAPWTEERRIEIMKPSSDSADLFEQFSGKTIEALTLCTDAGQKVVRELAELSTNTLKEGVDLSARLQTSTLDMVKAGQVSWLRHQSDFPRWMNDPVGTFHANLLEVMQETQKHLKVIQDTVQGMVQTAEHIQAANDKAAKGIQQTYNNLATGLKTVYSPPPPKS